MKQYLDMLNYVLYNGVASDDRTGVGTIRVFGYQNRYDLNNFPIVTTKKVFFSSVVKELLWFISGSCDNSILDCGIWNAWSDIEHTKLFNRKKDDLGPIYGHQWRNACASPYSHHNEFYSHKNRRHVIPYLADDGVDQLKFVVEEIQKNPNSRRLIVSGWNPREQNMVSLPPCHTLFQFSVINNALSCQLYQRSSDAFLGVPFNISSYALLTHMIAHVCGLEVGDFIHTFGDLHIYKNHIDQVKLQLTRTPMSSPKLILNQIYKLSGFEGLLDFKLDDIILEGYDPYPVIKAEVAV
jgi:thymidylate synthase